jgi:hypothetical protein
LENQSFELHLLVDHALPHKRYGLGACTDNAESYSKAQDTAGGKRRTIGGKIRCEVELKLRGAQAKWNTNTLEKARRVSDTDWPLSI